MTRLRDGVLSVVVVAMLLMQFGVISHALNHLSASLAQGGRTASASTVSLASVVVEAPVESVVCLKCLEDLAHSFALVSRFTHTGLTGAHILARVVLPPGLLFLSPERANQRAPPALLS